MSDQGSVQGQSTLSRSGSAALLSSLKKTKAPSRDHQSHIHFGDQPSDFVSCSAEAFRPMPPKTAKERGAVHDNAKYLRGVHWTLGGDTDATGISTCKDAYKQPPPQLRDAMFGDKTSNQKTQWSLGFDDVPNQYETCNEAELSQPALLRGQTLSGPDDHSAKIAQARATTITLGSEPSNYESMSRAAHINFGQNVSVDPGLATEKCKMMRITNFTFGAEDNGGPLPKTESQNQYKFHGDPRFLKDQIVAEIPGGGTKGLQKTHMYLGNSERQMQSEFRTQFGKVDDLMEAAKHPVGLDPEQKKDLRACHYYLGTDSGPANSESREAFGQRVALPGGEKALEAERKHLLEVRKDLRATHINLGTDNVKGVTSTAKDSYSHPIGKPVGGRDDTDGFKKEDHYKCNWSVGIDDESLREIRRTTMAHQDFADGVAKVNYGQLASMDEATKADLRKSHFYFGKESFPKQSASREAFVPHISKRYVIPDHIMKDLRKEHFAFGTDDGLGNSSKTTSQEAMIYHGAKAYRTDTNAAAETKKTWAKSSYNPGSHDGPRLSVFQADYKFREGL